MALTEAGKAAFAKWVIDTLNDAQTQAEIQAQETKKGIPYGVTNHINLLQNKQQTHSAEEGKITALKNALQKQNQIANKALEDYYKTASDEIESLVGFFGKDHKFSHILRQKRDSMSLEAARGPKTPKNPS
jgi:hypothetical protein